MVLISCPLELSQFERQHFSRVHLLIEKFNDQSKLGRNVVGNEQQAYPTGLKICLERLPKFDDVAGYPSCSEISVSAFS